MYNAPTILVHISNTNSHNDVNQNSTSIIDDFWLLLHVKWPSELVLFQRVLFQGIA